MNTKKLFRHISSQSKAKRDSYALIVAGTFTGLVALIWAFSLPEKMGTLAGAVESEAELPFSNFLDEAGAQLAAVKEGFKNEETASTTEVVTPNKPEEITLSPEEVEKAKQVLANNASSSEAIPQGTSTLPVPVLIATTSATTSMKTSTSTP
jgi:triphosphoribosyl-dephospho-CoA synthetase